MTSPQKKAMVREEEGLVGEKFMVEDKPEFLSKFPVGSKEYEEELAKWNLEHPVAPEEIPI